APRGEACPQPDGGVSYPVPCDSGGGNGGARHVVGFRMGVSAASGGPAGCFLVLPAFLSRDRLAVFAGRRVVDWHWRRDSGTGVMGGGGYRERHAGCGHAETTARRLAGPADVLDRAARPGGDRHGANRGRTGVSWVSDPSVHGERFRKATADGFLVARAHRVLRGFRAAARRPLDRGRGGGADLRAG